MKRAIKKRFPLRTVLCTIALIATLGFHFAIRYYPYPPDPPGSGPAMTNTWWYVVNDEKLVLVNRQPLPSEGFAGTVKFSREWADATDPIISMLFHLAGGHTPVSLSTLVSTQARITRVRTTSVQSPAIMEGPPELLGWFPQLQSTPSSIRLTTHIITADYTKPIWLLFGLAVSLAIVLEQLFVLQMRAARRRIREHRLAVGRCTSCGYTVGKPHQPCPECGASPIAP